MDIATATTADLVDIRRAGWTAAATLDLADVETFVAENNVPTELADSIRAQVLAARTAEAELGEQAEAELQRRRLSGVYGRTVDLRYIR